MLFIYIFCCPKKSQGEPHWPSQTFIRCLVLLCCVPLELSSHHSSVLMVFVMAAGVCVCVYRCDLLVFVGVSEKERVYVTDKIIVCLMSLNP